MSTLTEEQELELQRMIAAGGIDIDDVVGIGERIKTGRAIVRLIGGEAKKSTAGKDQVVARYEIKSHEAKDQIVFDGGDGKATLFKIVGKGKEPQRVDGKKIIYLRSTGQCWIDRASLLEGLGTGGAFSPGR